MAPADADVAPFGDGLRHLVDCGLGALGAVAKTAIAAEQILPPVAADALEGAVDIDQRVIVQGEVGDGDAVREAFERLFVQGELDAGSFGAAYGPLEIRFRRRISCPLAGAYRNIRLKKHEKDK